jgi:hypothetical protein
MACFYISFKPNYRKNDALPISENPIDEYTSWLVSMQTFPVCVIGIEFYCYNHFTHVLNFLMR